MEKQKVEKIKLVRLKESLILGGFGKTILSTEAFLEIHGDWLSVLSVKKGQELSIKIPINNILYMIDE